MKIHQVSAGPFHSLVLTDDGRVLSFGNSKDGKLGYEELKTNVMIPKAVEGIIFNKKWSSGDDRNKRYPIFNPYDDCFVLNSSGDGSKATEILQISVS